MLLLPFLLAAVSTFTISLPYTPQAIAQLVSPTMFVHTFCPDC